MGKACDIDWSKPSGSALAAAGFTVASLYVGQDNTGKNMTSAVVNDYHSHGVAVVTNFEYGAMQMANGQPQGVSDARLGLSQAQACGMPGGRPIYYSADWAATTAQIQNGIIPYLAGARSVTGPGSVGVYGSYYVVSAVHAYWQANFPGEKIWLWQTAAWSNGNVYSPIDMYQDTTTSVVAGITIDNDVLKSADVGQWPPPVVTQTVHEDDMAFIAQFNADSANPSAGSGIFLVDGGKLLAFANANTALAFKNQLGLGWVTVTDGATLTNFKTTDPAAVVNVDPAVLASDLAADLVVDLKATPLNVTENVTGTVG